MTNYQARLFAATAVLIAGAWFASSISRDAAGITGTLLMVCGVAAFAVNSKKD